MRQYTIRNILLVIVCMGLMVGCAGLTPQKTYLATHKTFNDMVEDYKVYYENVPAEERARLNEKVNPTVVEALNLSILISDAMSGIGSVSEEDKAVFKQLRFELYRQLPEIFPQLEGG